MGLVVAAGLFFRIASIALWLLLTYIFLLESAKYLNHFYLMCLLAFMLAWMPAHRIWSLDRWRGALRDGSPPTVPFWPVFLLRAQLFIVYFYGGLTKIHPDWFTGTPVHGAAQRGLQWLTSGLSEAHASAICAYYKEFALFLSLGGLLFDLAIGFLLIFRRTRYFALLLCLFFHGFNHFVFSIGVFPFLAFSGTLIFCEPDWPRRVWNWLRRPRLVRPDWAWAVGGAVAAPLAGLLLGWRARPAAPVEVAQPPRLPRWAAALVAAWVIAHCLIPLRHYVIPGDAAWTEEHARFAWRMMSRSKNGSVHLQVVDPGLLVTDGTGASQVDWNEWTKVYPKRLYVPISAILPPWIEMPAITVLFEPLIGERVVINRRAFAEVSTEEMIRQVQDQWRATYGRTPQIRATVSLPEVVDTLSRLLQQQQQDAPHPGRDVLVRELERVRTLAAERPTNPVRWESRCLEMSCSLERVLRSHLVGPELAQCLRRVHPLVLQGCLEESTAYVVEDPALFQPAHRNWQRLDRKAWKGSELVHLDMMRVTCSGWEVLPEVLVYYDQGQPHFRWNQLSELTTRQANTLGQLPFVVHQYANRVADRWEANFGRRPAVYAHASLVRVNRRPPQPIIDPRVDLASAKLHWLRHNSWILPAPNEVAEQQPLIAEAAGEQQLQLYEVSRFRPTDDLVRAKQATYPNGQKMCEEHVTYKDGRRHSLLKVYYEEGYLMMQAAYVEGVQHGPAVRWHRNGQMATLVHYAGGKRHGPATVWYENGQKAWEGHFHNGRRHGPAQSWFADGRPAECGQFENNRKVGVWTELDPHTRTARQVDFSDAAVR